MKFFDKSGENFSLEVGIFLVLPVITLASVYHNWPVFVVVVVGDAYFFTPLEVSCWRIIVPSELLWWIFAHVLGRDSYQ